MVKLGWFTAIFDSTWQPAKANETGTNNLEDPIGNMEAVDGRDEANAEEATGPPQGTEPVDPAEKRLPQRGAGCGCGGWLMAAVFLLAAVAGLIWFAINQAQRIPEFYGRLLESETPAAAKQGREFERNLITLQNSARNHRPWRVDFTQDQINGWLAVDFPKKFPNSLPSQIKDPRAVLHQDELKLAFKYESTGITGVVVVTAEVFAIDQSNEIAVHVKDVRSGFIPLPANVWMERVSKAIRDAGVPFYWTNSDESPVAIFSIPDNLPVRGKGFRVAIEAINLLPEKLVIAGRREPIEPDLNDEEKARPESQGTDAD